MSQKEYVQLGGLKLQHIDYTITKDIPKRSGQDREDKDLETWKNSGLKLVHFMETKDHQTIGSKKKIISAIKRGLEILKSHTDHDVKTIVVSELNQLKYVCGDYWGKWKGSLRNKNKSQSNRVTCTFDIEKGFLEFLSVDKLKGTTINELQREILSCGFHSLSDLKQVDLFIKKYRAKSAEHEKLRWDTNNDYSALFTINEIRKLFKKENIENYEQLKEFFKMRRKKVNDAKHLITIRKRLSCYNFDTQAPESFIKELKELVAL